MVKSYINYTHQANQILFDVIQNHGVTDEKIRKILSHIILSAQSMIALIKQAPIEQETFVIKPTKELTQINTDNQTTLLQLFKNVPADTFITVITKDNRNLSNYFHDILQHLFFHAAHHRGQISMLLSDRIKLPLEINYLAYKSHEKQILTS